MTKTKTTTNERPSLKVAAVELEGEIFSRFGWHHGINLCESGLI